MFRLLVHIQKDCSCFQAKLVTKELEQARIAQQGSDETANYATNKQRDNEKLLKKANWEIKDITAMKDARYKCFVGFI